MEIVWKSLEFWIQNSVRTQYIQVILQKALLSHWDLGKPSFPTQAKLLLNNCKILHSKFTRLSQSWLHVGEYHEKLRTIVLCERRRKNKMLGKKGELATIFDKFSFPSRKQWKTAKQSTTGINVFIFTTWHDMDLWCIN